MARAHAVSVEGKRVAIVAGLRTPFQKQGAGYGQLSALDLGALVVNELMQQSGVRPSEVQQLVFGQVVPSVSAPNVAREIVLSTGLPQDIDAYSVSRACATSYQSLASVVDAIAAGAIDCGIAGGTDSASDVPVTVSNRLRDALFRASKAKGLPAQLGAFSRLSPKDLLPIPPAIKERSTGLSMGESAEKMAKENGIPRKEQDAFAHRSHQRAAGAWKEGLLAEEVMDVYVPRKFKETVSQDGLVRFDSELEAYARLRPAFDRKFGTITAGNSSPLTDGASAVLLMRGDKAASLGLAPLGYVRSYAFSALDPRGQMLMGPSYATPAALTASGMKLSDLTLLDMHEAFAAQVLSNTQAFESKEWAERELGASERIGEIHWDRFNVLGGSIAFGHPFAATGTRQVTQVLNELRRRGGGVGLCTACAAGGLGAAVLLEAA